MYVCVLILLTHIAYDDIVFDGLDGLPSLSQIPATQREKDLLKIQQEREKMTYSKSSKRVRQEFACGKWRSAFVLAEPKVNGEEKGTRYRDRIHIIRKTGNNIHRE